MITGRMPSRNEIEQVRQIDRSELIERLYYLEDGALVLKPERYDMRGWPPGQPDEIIAELAACHARGGWLYALFDGEQMVGIVALDNRFIGPDQDQLQLLFLHVGAKYRDQGLGTRLFEAARAHADACGARQLYVSATPSEHTIEFYLGRGCLVTPEPDPELFALEPEDIHLVCDL